MKRVCELISEIMRETGLKCISFNGIPRVS